MNAALEQFDAYWMPFTANRDFKKAPRLISRAEGHYYHTPDGRRLYDGFSGLWTCGLGHCHPKIAAAVQKQLAQMDYCMAFQMGGERAFELAEKLTGMAPPGFNHCFFTNSGSESADTALKIALAYHRAGAAAQRTRLIPQVDHLPHTYCPEHTAFSRGQPEWGAHLAAELERLCGLHGGENIAAVMVEPVAGSDRRPAPARGLSRKTA